MVQKGISKVPSPYAYISTKSNKNVNSKSQLEDFLRRLNKAGLHVAESGTGNQDSWEIIEKECIQDYLYKDTWVLVGIN
jgi:hypothetical protein